MLLTVLLTVLPLAPRPAVASRAATPVGQSNALCQPLRLREVVAQTVMSGVAGTNADASTRALVARDAGSVLLMHRNLEARAQLRTLIAELRDAAPAGLLVAVDEEGGRVSRLARAGIIDSFPSARDVAASSTPDDVRALGASVGKDLRALGVDMDLAPVLDVTGASGGTVVGDRSYAPDASTVATFGHAFAQGLKDEGVLTVGKHFPGHGRTAVDSHDRLPVVAASVLELIAEDLRPFARSIPTMDAVMTAHVVFPALDPAVPASLSPATTTLLRDLYGFDGLIITDALEMGAVTSNWDLPEAAVSAIAAGADLALLSGPGEDTAAVTDALVTATRSGRIPAARLRSAAGRVLAAKGMPTDQVRCLLGPAPGHFLASGRFLP